MCGKKMSLDKVKEILIDLDIDEIANAVNATLDEGVAAQDIVSALSEAMLEVGKLYEGGPIWKRGQAGTAMP